jgi:hypothetical protein
MNLDSEDKTTDFALSLSPLRYRSGKIKTVNFAIKKQGKI